MPTKVQLIGGAFQDAEGAVLANGYLKMKLSQDGSVPSIGSICSGVEVTIKLNSSGSVDTSTPQYVWGNDQIFPANSFYRVTGYTAQGQPAWGPNNQQVVGNGGTFDVGTWVPNQVLSWTPSISSPLLKTNGVANTIQSVLNLIAGSGVSLTNSGGNVTVSGGGGGGAGFISIDITSVGPGGTYVLSPTEASNNIIQFRDNGSLSGTISIQFPSATPGLWVIENLTSTNLSCGTTDAFSNTAEFNNLQLLYSEGSLTNPGLFYVFTPASYLFNFPYINGKPSAGQLQTLVTATQFGENQRVVLRADSANNGAYVYCETPPTSNQSFLIEASGNGGVTWTSWATLQINAGSHNSNIISVLGNTISHPSVIRVTCPNPQDATMAGVAVAVFGSYQNLEF